MERANVNHDQKKEHCAGLSKALFPIPGNLIWLRPGMVLIIQGKAKFMTLCARGDHIFFVDESGFPPQPNKDHQVLSSELDFSLL